MAPCRIFINLFVSILAKPESLLFHVAHVLDPGVQLIGLLREARDEISFFLGIPRGEGRSNVVCSRL